MATTKQTTDKLVCTDYDNFKNLDFFRKQYNQAKKMLKEVDDFFESFISSKLIESKDLGDYPNATFIKTEKWRVDGYPNIHVVSDHPWVKHFSKNAVPMQYREWCSCYDNSESSIQAYERLKPKVLEYDRQLVEFFASKTTKANGLLFVLDSHNRIVEFVPSSLKKNIRYDFSKDGKMFILSCDYYEHQEVGNMYSDWGNHHEVLTITRKLYFDAHTNNFVKAETITEDRNHKHLDRVKSWYISTTPKC